MSLTEEEKNKIDNHLKKLYPKVKWVQNLYKKVIFQHLAMDLADSHFTNELTSNDEYKFNSRLEEAIFGCKLQSLGHKLCPLQNGKGPDFLFRHNNSDIYVEVIAPTPSKVPEDWQNPKPGKSYRTPNKELLLRYTAAFKEKAERFKKYKIEKLIKEDSACIIAISSRQLSKTFPIDRGDSGYPFSVEVAFPIGPRCVEFTSPPIIPPTVKQYTRYSVKNHNGADIPTGLFLEYENHHISAIIEVQRFPSLQNQTIEGMHLTVVHNPRAKNKIPMGLFGENSTEYTLTYQVREHEKRMIKSISTHPSGEKWYERCNA